MNRNTKEHLAERTRITKLADRLISQYKEMKDERAQIHSWEWENDFDFSILGLMDLYSSYVGGYASPIATRGTVKKPAEALKLLQEKRFFYQPYFVDWYFSPDNNYIKVQEYVEDVEYLRLLIIQYIKLYQNETFNESDSAPKPDKVRELQMA